MVTLGIVLAPWQIPSDIRHGISGFLRRHRGLFRPRLEGDAQRGAVARCGDAQILCLGDQGKT